MSLILWIIFGALAGWIASLVMKTNSQQGWLADIILGVIGAVVGGFIFNFFGAQGIDGFNAYSLVVAVVGAIAVLSLKRLV